MSAGGAASMASSGTGPSGVPSGVCGGGSATTETTICGVYSYSPVPEAGAPSYVPNPDDLTSAMTCPYPS
jgi:hypothetical protein